MKYDAITLDTNIFTNNGYALEHGLLKQLEQFKRGSVKFVLSEIVVREVFRHLEKENTEIRGNLDKAINRAKNKKLLAEKTADKLLKLTEGEPTPEKLALERIDAFKKNTGFQAIKADSAEISELIKRYFGYKPPFENNKEKRKEFPDAIALLSLEKYAKENNIKILAVSKDKGWIDFAASSKWIDVLTDMTDALSELQNHADEAKDVVSTFLEKITEDYNSDEYKSIYSIVEEQVNSTSVYAESDSFLRSESTYAEMVFYDFDFIGQSLFSIVQMGKDFVVAQVPIRVFVQASAEFDFYIYDSIDKDEIYAGSTSIQDHDVEFETAILVTLLIRGNKKDQKIIMEDVELVKVIDSVNFGEIGPDYSDEDPTFEKY